MEWINNKRGRIVPKAHTILIVEDNPINMTVIKHVLQQAQYNIVEATDGLLGYEMAVQCLPDLILLDVVMPGIDGFEVCRLLKKNHVTEDIPIVFMTGLSDTDSIVQAFELGAVDYVQKPFKTAEVLARLNTHLTLRNLQIGLEREIIEREKLIVDLDAFAHTVAHDLKNPISNVLGYSEVLVKNYERISPNQIKSTLGILAQSATKMRDIIDSLLLLARIRLEDIRIESVKMGDVVGEVCQRLQPMIREADAEIIVPEEWPIVRGYGPWLEEVWVNYLTNAVKYGGRPPHLELGATRKNKHEMMFWVKDNGDGLAADEQTKLFQPFVRLHSGQTTGHGLGLSIVQRIVDKLGGHVGVESQQGEGSTFYFTLPVVY
ncbi:MAG: hybrid sensor histidine kinase/response regulator [Chloroflexi bacterium]|nr:MAG: hybrid sensor histidine kinase/response regulator [Chloroflexota bacterium]